MYAFAVNGADIVCVCVCVLPFPVIVIGGLDPSLPVASEKVLDAAFAFLCSI